MTVLFSLFVCKFECKHYHNGHKSSPVMTKLWQFQASLFVSAPPTAWSGGTSRATSQNHSLEALPHCHHDCVNCCLTVSYKPQDRILLSSFNKIKWLIRWENVIISFQTLQINFTFNTPSTPQCVYYQNLCLNLIWQSVGGAESPTAAPADHHVTHKVSIILWKLH